MNNSMPARGWSALGRKKIKFLILLLLIFMVAGCTNNTQDDSTKKLLRGTSLSPRSFDEENDFAEFLERTRQLDAVTWAGDWIELGQGEGSGPNVLAGLSKKYGYTPIALATFFTQHTGTLERPLDQKNVKMYKDYAVSWAEKNKPKYLIFGIEVDVLQEKLPKEFDKFVTMYNDTYEAVKAVSPKTQISTTFVLEKMKGLNGGLYGGVNNPANTNWELLDKFKMDFVSFSTYPFIIYKNPSEIPSDYYTEIKNYTDKPIAFTEIGWHSDATIPGWESSEAEQAEFINKFFELTKELDVNIAIWSFMYDQAGFPPFEHTGLIDRNKKEKQGWTNWINR